MKSKQGLSGYWYKIRDYRTCCDCGLCHYEEYKISVKGKRANELIKKYHKDITIYFRCWRDKERTKENRKKLKNCGIAQI